MKVTFLVVGTRRRLNAEANVINMRPPRSHLPEKALLFLLCTKYFDSFLNLQVLYSPVTLV